jgi:hypothetical protein
MRKKVKKSRQQSRALLECSIRYGSRHGLKLGVSLGAAMIPCRASHREALPRCDVIRSHVINPRRSGYTETDRFSAGCLTSLSDGVVAGEM